MSPRKVRIVADLVSGLNVVDALDQLSFYKRAAAKPLWKLVKSAVANAEHNFKLSRADLIVKTITVDGGPTLKRFRPRAHGRAAPVRKRTSHIVVTLTDVKAKAALPIRKKTAKVGKP